MVPVDAGFLGLMLHPQAKAPLDPATKKPTEKVAERIEVLVESLEAANERILIPAPALCEFLVLAAQDGPFYLNEIHLQGTFSIQPFDERAACEAAAIEISARKKGSKRSPLTQETAWQKVKFDRQIVAIAKLHGAQVIYSDDKDVRSIAEGAGIRAVSCWELPLPASNTPLFDQLQNEP